MRKTPACGKSTPDFVRPDSDKGVTSAVRSAYVNLGSESTSASQKNANELPEETGKQSMNFHELLLAET